MAQPLGPTELISLTLGHVTPSPASPLTGKLGQASTDPLPELQAPEVAQEATPSRREEEADMERMQAALDGLLKG